MVPSALLGVSRIGERYSTSRLTTSNRWPLPSGLDWSVICANSRCAVVEPMSIPTVVRLTLLKSQVSSDASSP